MSNYTGIEKAIVASIQTHIAGGIPLQHPGIILETTPDSLWLALFNIPGVSKPVTLGDQGEDEHRGFFQVDVNYPKNKGSAQVLAKIDEIATAFPSGRTLTYNTQVVKILASSITPGRYVGGYYRVSLTVNYYARTKRL